MARRIKRTWHHGQIGCSSLLPRLGGFCACACESCRPELCFDLLWVVDCGRYRYFAIVSGSWFVAWCEPPHGSCLRPVSWKRETSPLRRSVPVSEHAALRPAITQIQAVSVPRSCRVSWCSAEIARCQSTFRRCFFARWRMCAERPCEEVTSSTMAGTLLPHARLPTSTHFSGHLGRRLPGRARASALPAHLHHISGEFAGRCSMHTAELEAEWRRSVLSTATERHCTIGAGQVCSACRAGV